MGIFGGVKKLLGGGGSQKVETNIDYPSWWSNQYLPLLEDVGSIYQQQSGTPLNTAQRDALAGMEAEARGGGSLGPSASNALQQLIQGGGMAQGTGQFARQMMGGQFANPAMDETQRIAMGGDVGNNPYLDAVYERASRPVTQAFNEITVPGMDREASRAGALGSGTYAQMRNRQEEATGNVLADLATGIYAPAYESERNRQMGALGQLGSLGQQDVANRAGGAAMLQQGRGQMLQGIGLAPGIDPMRYGDMAQLYGVGQQRQQAPWAPGIQFANLLNSTPGLAGAGTQITPSNQNPFANMLGGGLGAAGIAQGLGASGGMTAGIGGLGALAGLLSDRRAKTDIKRVGKTDSGLGVYTFKYRGTAGPTHLGLMAQEVKRKKPEAVITDPNSGMHRVLYELAA